MRWVSRTELVVLPATGFVMGWTMCFITDAKEELKRRLGRFIKQR